MNAAQAAISGAAFPENTAPASVLGGPPKTQDPRPKTQPFDYFERVLPTRAVVCGRVLKPISIGRYRRMKRQNVAFVADEAVDSPKTSLVGDLLKGVLICSMTCADYDSFLEQPDASRQIKKWAQQQGFLRERYYDWPVIGKWFAKYIVGEKVTQMRDERAAAYLLEQVELFQEYIAAAQRIPNYTSKQNEPARHSLHWSNSIELHLRSEQNWTTEEIEEAPLSKALADYFGYAESNGLISILTDAKVAEAEENAKKITAILAFLEKQKSATPESAQDPIRQTPDPA